VPPLNVLSVLESLAAKQGDAQHLPANMIGIYETLQQERKSIAATTVLVPSKPAQHHHPETPRCRLEGLPGRSKDFFPLGFQFIRETSRTSAATSKSSLSWTGSGTRRRVLAPSICNSHSSSLSSPSHPFALADSCCSTGLTAQPGSFLSHHQLSQLSAARDGSSPALFAAFASLV